MEKCPSCGRTLEGGYVISPRGVWWHTKKPRLWAYSGEKLSGWSRSAQRCSQCGLVIFAYDIGEATPAVFLKKCVRCSADIPIASETCSACGSEQK